MGYTRKKSSSNVLKRILSNCDKLINSMNHDKLGDSISRLGINNKMSGLSGGSLRNLDLKNDAELELTCRTAFDKTDVVVKIEAVIDKTGKAVLLVNRNG